MTTNPTKTRHRSPAVREPADGLWSNCLRVGEQIFVAGMTARGEDGETVIGSDSYEQSKVIFTKIRDLVNAAGAEMDDVVKMTIFVTDIAGNTGVWQARREFFTGDFPACTLVEVAGLAKPELLVEIEALAIAGTSSNL